MLLAAARFAAFAALAVRAFGAGTAGGLAAALTGLGIVSRHGAGEAEAGNDGKQRARLNQCMECVHMFLVCGVSRVVCRVSCVV